MFNLLKKSLSGEKSPERLHPASSMETPDNGSVSEALKKQRRKKNKRYRSGDTSVAASMENSAQKRKKLQRCSSVESASASSSDSEEDGDLAGDLVKMKSLPAETPDWGMKLIEIMQGEFRTLSRQIKAVKKKTDDNIHDVSRMTSKLSIIEKKNQDLENENNQLRERLLDLEYRQRRSNLIFEGIEDAPKESDLDCIRKVRFVLSGVAGLDAANFRIDRLS